MKTIGMTAQQRAAGGQYAGTAETGVRRAAAQSRWKVSKQLARSCAEIGVEAQTLLRFCGSLGNRLYDKAEEAHATYYLKSMTALHLAEVYIQQRGLCALTGWPLALALREPSAATPWRKNWRWDYEPGNTILVARVVAERMKGMPVKEFIKLCAAVSRHDGGRGGDASLLAEIEAAPSS